MKIQLDCTRYGNFVGQLKDAYRHAGFMFEPGVWYDEEERLAHPIAILAIYKQNVDYFLHWGRFLSERLMIKWFEENYLRGNWLWCYGFLAAVDKADKQPWKGNESFDAGWKVGREVRKRLLEWNR